jgi:hypothetical protein
MDLRSGGQVYADSYLGTGDSGDIAVSAGSISVTGFGTSQAPYPVPGFTGFSTTTNAGRGGTILLSAAGDFSLSNGGGIKSDTQGSGLGGTISIGAQDVTLTDGAAISSSSVGSGNAGNVNITAGNSVTLRSSMISTEALLSDGGNISISAPGTVSLFESRITASVGGGAQTVGGNIVIDPQFVILRNGQITANAYEGQGGNIQIVSNTFLADPNSVVDASSALGIDGTVNILATNRIVSGLLNPLPSDYVSATSLLREQCMARLRGGKYSSFIIGSRDGLPSEPGNPMPGLLH